MTQSEPITFGDVGVSIDLLQILDAKKLTNPTPIQEKCISLGLEGKDIVGVAQTGTGKTLAFGLPAIQKIRKGNCKCVIMLPTRELAIQVDEVLSDLGKSFGIKTALLIGGVSSYPQKIALRKKPQIIIATPGRLIDHIQRKNCNLSDINLVVLDEADRMLDIGFMPQIREILKSIPTKRQTMLFSATIPMEISDLSVQYMNNPVRIEVSPSGTSAKNVKQEAYIVKSENKQPLLKEVIKETSGSVLVFTRTKHKAKKIALVLRNAGFNAVEMHSNRSLDQRRKALEGFKSGKFKILVATDVAARGLDVDDISLVVNFDLPNNAEDYVHRIGRTGRAGKSGKALAFIEPNEKFKLNKIERLIKKNIIIIKGSEELTGVSDRPQKRYQGRKRRPSNPQWGRKNKPSRNSTKDYGRNSKTTAKRNKKRNKRR
ncbi:DEAD/DEAH box helicase [Candidatus Falkowbacteria bacterium]|jgi:ATP-dependent RNA helicase RhlE|nr:DEAD/DEAH box helicase [Candidatus Falkowbacteria bacterium]MBT5502600.1 DEAD/DEAH box helicase [Candidatus Falkowbacteria bacterium]MBT6574591.1 DEAD/DEAH box helicase [Candidatus Falkowbacteria bacterium]MBT7349002.1 DEAD/DEAH box helicase [Candidatus Falkowbacteria bacterium]MBT7500344.1 DEAD/DEAH box helicase [Candidatus Falkowbacteria bacterium]